MSNHKACNKFCLTFVLQVKEAVQAESKGSLFKKTSNKLVASQLT